MQCAAVYRQEGQRVEVTTYPARCSDTLPFNMAKELKPAGIFGPQSVDVHVHLANSDVLAKIQISLDSILKNQVKMMASLDDVVAADAALKTEVDEIVDYVSQEKQMIADLQAVIAAGGLSPADQAKAEAILADLSAMHDKLAGALPTP